MIAKLYVAFTFIFTTQSKPWVVAFVMTFRFYLEVSE